MERVTLITRNIFDGVQYKMIFVNAHGIQNELYLLQICQNQKLYDW